MGFELVSDLHEDHPELIGARIVPALGARAVSPFVVVPVVAFYEGLCAGIEQSLGHHWVGEFGPYDFQHDILGPCGPVLGQVFLSAHAFCDVGRHIGILVAVGLWRLHGLEGGLGVLICLAIVGELMRVEVGQEEVLVAEFLNQAVPSLS